MEETQTQAVPNSGASNAEDFQPTTRNPQTAPVADVQEQSDIQGVTNPQEFLNENKTAEISITTNPAPAQAEVKSDITSLIIIAVIAIIVGIVLFKISSKLPDKKVAKTEVPEEPVVAEAVAEPEKLETEEVPKETEAVEAAPVPKKSAAKKKSAKKSKRRNK